jgi:hypothetical protein
MATRHNSRFGRAAWDYQIYWFLVIQAASPHPFPPEHAQTRRDGCPTTVSEKH